MFKWKNRFSLGEYKVRLRQRAHLWKRQGRRTAKTYLKKPLNRKQKKNLAGVILFLIVALILGILVSKPLGKFLTDPSEFQAFAKDQPVFAAIAMVGIMCLQIVIAVIPGEPVQLAAGYAFGSIWGTILALGGSALGSAIVFLLVKRYGRVVVDLFFSQEQLDKVDFIHDSKRLNLLVFILMFIPGTPKDLITYVIGLTPMKLSTWLLISIPARTPALLASTIAGASFGSGDHKVTIIVIAITGVLALLGIAYYAFLTKQAREQKHMERMIAHYRSVKAQAPKQATNAQVDGAAGPEALEQPNANDSQDPQENTAPSDKPEHF